MAINLSFEEKSVWIQLVGVTVGLGAYFAVAGVMMRNGVTALPAYVPLFIVATVLLVVLLTFGYIAAALTGRTGPRDERDKLIAWRAQHGSSWVVAAGAFCAVMAMVIDVPSLWVAHGLLASLFASEVLKCVLQLVYYRRGV